jgi:hypothetical protein
VKLRNRILVTIKERSRKRIQRGSNSKCTKYSEAEKGKNEIWNKIRKGIYEYMKQLEK